MPVARPVGRVFSPLDQELELLPGQYTPTLVEHMVRLGARLEFALAARELLHMKRVHVSEPTVRRDTEKAGDSYVEVQAAQLAALEKELPPVPQGPPLQQIGVDGALVPLLHGQWAEVKSLAIGTVGESVLERGEWVVHTKALSYFSRLADHESFTRQATLETQRRGTETADQVCAVNDGAEWEQKFVDYHRPEAVRILDWGHASEYVAKAGHAAFGTGTAEASEWVGKQLHELKHGDRSRCWQSCADSGMTRWQWRVGCRAKRRARWQTRWSTSRSARRRFATPSFVQPVTQSAAGRWRAATSSSSRLGSKGRGCTGRASTWMGWWRYVRPCAVIAGMKRGYRLARG